MQLFRLKNALHKSTTTKFVKTIALVATLVILAVLPCRFCIAQEEENSSDSAADVFITMRDQHNADFQLELSHKPADPDALRAAAEKAIGDTLQGYQTETLSDGHWRIWAQYRPGKGSDNSPKTSTFAVLKLVPWMQKNEIDVFSLSVFVPAGTPTTTLPAAFVQDEPAYKETRYYWSTSLHELHVDLTNIHWQAGYSPLYLGSSLLLLGLYPVAVLLLSYRRMRRYLNNFELNEQQSPGTVFEMVLYNRLLGKFVGYSWMAILLWRFPPASLRFLNITHSLANSCLLLAAISTAAWCATQYAASAISMPLIDRIYNTQTPPGQGAILATIDAALFCVPGVFLGMSFVSLTSNNDRAGFLYLFLFALLFNGIARFRHHLSGVEANMLEPGTQIAETVSELAKAAGLSGVTCLSFFGYGPGPGLAQALYGKRILITDGMPALLNQRELRGVLAHEVAHIKQKHLVIYACKRLALLALYPLILMFNPWVVWNAGKSVFLAGLPLIPVLVYPLGAKISRLIEYKTDAVAAALAGEAAGLASGLEVYRKASHSPTTWRRSTGWLMTHPDFESRFRRLGFVGSAAIENPITEQSAVVGKIRRPALTATFRKFYSNDIQGLYGLAVVCPIVIAGLIVAYASLSGLLMVAVMAGAVILALDLIRIISDRAPASRMITLRSRLSRSLAEEGKTATETHFCGIVPGANSQMSYLTLPYADIGEVSVTEDGIFWAGDLEDFNLPWNMVTAVEYAANGDYANRGTAVTCTDPATNVSGTFTLYLLPVSGALHAAQSVDAFRQLLANKHAAANRPAPTQFDFEIVPSTPFPCKLPPEKWLSAPTTPATAALKQALFASYIYGLIVCALLGGLTGNAQRNTPYAVAILCAVFMVVINSWYHKRGLKRIKR